MSYDVLVHLDPSNAYLQLRFAYASDILEKVKAIPGRVFKASIGNAWLIPFTQASVQDLLAQLAPARVYVDEKVTETMVERARQASGTRELKAGPAVAGVYPPGFRFHTEPMAHQARALELGRRRAAFALFMEMGTGKTKVMLDLLKLLQWEASLRGPTLVVAPVPVTDVWRSEAEKHRPDLRVVVLQGSRAARLRTLETAVGSGADVVVTNYEATWRLEAELLKVRWGAVVLDESTRIKHRATKQTRTILRLGKLAPRRYILTGTPAANDPTEVFSQFKFLDPTILGPSFFAFRDRYCVMGGFRGHEVVGYQHLPELAAQVAGHSFRVLKKDCLDLPEKVYQERRLELGEDQGRAYAAMAKDLVTTVQDTEVAVTIVLAKLTKLRQLSSGFVYGPDGTPRPTAENPKLDALTEILREVAATHKVVVWCSFREEVAQVTELCRRLVLCPVEFTGGEDAAAQVKDFQTLETHRVFVGTARAGGIGITLTAADYCVFFSNEYSAEVRAQAEDRLHRKGQRNSVTYVDLLVKGTVDVAIRRTLNQKRDLSLKVTPENVEEVVYGE